MNDSFEEVFLGRWPRADSKFNCEFELNFYFSLLVFSLSSCAFSDAYVWFVKAKFLHFLEKPPNPVLVRVQPEVLVIVRLACFAATADILWICQIRFGFAQRIHC